MSGRKRQGRGQGRGQLLDQLGKVFSIELPVEGRSHALVVLLEIQQSILYLLEAGEIVGGQNLALDDGEVDLDLIEPTGVNWSMNGDQVGKGFGQASHA